MRGALALILSVGVAGCGRSCKNDHPYVPYSIGDDAGPQEAIEDAAAPLGADDAHAPAAVGVAAPPGATRWTLDGLDLVAPADRVFVTGLARDLDGDGVKDALAVVRAKDAGVGGQALFYKGRGANASGGVDAPAAVAAPPFAAPDPSCTATDALSAVGKRSAAIELGAECKAPLGGVRWIGVVTFDPRPRVHLELMVSDPANAPRLLVEPDASDRDGDGIDDVTLRVTIDAPSAPFEPMPRATAKVAWFDRPAGLSRDSDEPDASLRALAQGATARASRAKEAPVVAGTVHQIRALFAAMCAEGGAPRVLKPAGGAAITCGPSRALEEAGMALVRAHATMGDAVGAAWALDRAQLPPATKTAARTAEATAWIAQAFPVASAPRQLRAISAVPLVERGAPPAWGPLAFEPNGKLLVRTSAGVVRVDPSTGDEADAPDVLSWKPAVVSPDGTLRWTEAYAACDGAAIHAAFTPIGDAQARDVVVPVAVPLGSRCASGKGEAARAVPLAWGPRGLEALIAGEPILFTPDLARASLAAAPVEQPVPSGSPRAPNGKALAVATSQGIAVRAAKTRLFRAKELDGGYLELQGCTVSDDATMVACVRGGRAFVGTWE